MNEEHMLSCVSFLLGKTHGAIVMALQSEPISTTVDKIIELEAELRKEIERLYYPVNPHNPETHS
jgi:hypothetical protein